MWKRIPALIIGDMRELEATELKREFPKDNDDRAVSAAQLLDMTDPGTRQKWEFRVPGTELHIPCTLIRGKTAGEFIVLSAGVHSREYIGIQALCELAGELDPEKIAGSIFILHCCNYEGFICRSADVVPEDGKNLNRCFPGNPEGSATERLASSLEEKIYPAADYLVDLHSGGFCESLIPHVYFQGTASAEVCAASRRMAELTSASLLVRSEAENGFYSWAGQCGVPAIILERGGCGLVVREEIEADKRDVMNILRGLGFLRDTAPVQLSEHIVIRDAYYENSPGSGCWYPKKAVGERVKKGEQLGEIRDFYGNLLQIVTAKSEGRVLYQTVSLGIEEGTPMLPTQMNGFHLNR